MSQVLVMDNGTGLLKAGFANDTQPRIMPNAIMRPKVSRASYIGAQIEDCKNLAGLFYKRPAEKGYLIDYDMQRMIWNYVFGKDCLRVNCLETSLLVTEPMLNFEQIHESMNELIFEEFQFKSCFRRSAPDLCAIRAQLDNPDNPCCLVVDSGFAFTHVVPYYDGKCLFDKVQRLDLGGKHLTSQYKELISYRQLDVMEETNVINQLKEDVSFVSLDFLKDLDLGKKPDTSIHSLEYTLPDFSTNFRGQMRVPELNVSQRRKGDFGKEAKDSQTLFLSNERFTVPELLFNPSDIGLNQAGIPECVYNSINTSNLELHTALYSNIVLMGGNACIPNFEERFLMELRSRAPVEYYSSIKTNCSPDPVVYAWQCGAEIAKSTLFDQYAVTRAQYEEHGHNIPGFL